MFQTSKECMRHNEEFFSREAGVLQARISILNLKVMDEAALGTVPRDVRVLQVKSSVLIKQGMGAVTFFSEIRTEGQD
jgi:hypothetical protein